MLPVTTTVIAQDFPTKSIRMPELPAVAEAGVKDYEVSTWYGVLAPAHTPKAIVTRLHCEIVKICESQWSRAFEHAFSLT